MLRRCVRGASHPPGALDVEFGTVTIREGVAIEELLGLMDDVFTRSEQVLTIHCRLRPEMVSQVIARAPELVSYDEVDGIMLPSLNQPLVDAASLSGFLRSAIAHQSRIAAD